MSAATPTRRTAPYRPVRAVHPVTTAGYLTFASGTGNYLDDIVVLKLNGDTVETETQVYNAANELTSQVVKGVTVSYAYDQFGRLTQKSKTGSRVANFYYNYGDKLTKVSSNFQGEGTVTYTYSGDQKRRSRSVSGGAMTKYRVDQGFGVVNEENSGGTLLSTYIHHPGRQIGTVLATSEGSTASSGTWNYYFQDAIGSTRSLWDEDGDRLGKYDYTPFGGKYGNTGEEITRKFTGHDWDNEARLYHTAYRQYSPDTGRWLTRDPLGMVDGPNVYAYVVNNPVSAYDAKGGFLVRFAKELIVITGILAVFDIALELILTVDGVFSNPPNGKCDYGLLAFLAIWFLFYKGFIGVMGVFAILAAGDTTAAKVGVGATFVWQTILLGLTLFTSLPTALNALAVEARDCTTHIVNAIFGYLDSMSGVRPAMAGALSPQDNEPSCG